MGMRPGPAARGAPLSPPLRSQAAGPVGPRAPPQKLKPQQLRPRREGSRAPPPGGAPAGEKGGVPMPKPGASGSMGARCLDLPQGDRWGSAWDFALVVGSLRC